MTDDPLLTIAELAEWLNVPVATVRDWRARAHMAGPPAIKVGAAVRYRRSDVEAWLDSQREQPRPTAARSWPARRRVS